ncbi:MAG TPA: glycoside hydrolase family 15 protein [Candidatus Dormibacteraeota bacterium]
MPRSLVIGNGRVLIDFDADYEMRDIFYPHVGQWNHTLGNVCRTGFYADGRLAWLGDDGWERKLAYVEDALVTDVELTHAELGLSVHFHDYVDMARDFLVRSVTVAPHRPIEKLRAFFHHDWYIQESDLGCTVLYEPRHKALVAYKNDFYFLVGGQVGRDHGIHRWAAGKKGNGLQGTWVDALDGDLACAPIDQGSVDSTVMFDLGSAQAGHAKSLKLWLCFGHRLSETTQFGQEIILHRGESTYRNRTETYWKHWVDKDRHRVETDLGSEIRDLYRRSVLTVRSHADAGGGVVAATDFDITKFARDTYAYVWPRDAAIAVNALDRAGHEDVTRRFFLFARETLVEEGFFLHKYTPAGNPGSSWHPWIDKNGQRVLPVQEDETGLVLWALWQHYSKHRALDFVVDLYTTLVVPAANWMMDYADQNAGLPKPSWDLWEERWGVHAFSIGAIWAGLEAAREFAELFGDEQMAAKLKTYAHILRQSTDRLLYREELGRFARRINANPDGIEVDKVIDSAITGLWRFGMYSPMDPRIVATMQQVQEQLRINSECGGIARYADDYYFQVDKDVQNVPGNPWFICTLWVAQWLIASAKDLGDLLAPRRMLEWVCEHQLPGGLLSEQLDPHTGGPLSVSPLTWSHAEFVVTVDDYMHRAEELKVLEKTGNS